MDNLTLSDHLKLLGPPGKLLVLIVIVVLIWAIARIVRCMVAKDRRWNALGTWLKQAAVFLTMCSFMYACLLGVLISRGHRLFIADRISGWILLTRELEFHFRTLLAVSLVFTGLYIVGSIASTRAKAREIH